MGSSTFRITWKRCLRSAIARPFCATAAKSACIRSRDLTKTTLIKDMVGRDPSTFYKRERVERGEVVLAVRNVTGNGVRNISFDLRRGEVLGIRRHGRVGTIRTHGGAVRQRRVDLRRDRAEWQAGQALKPEGRDPEQDVLHHRGSTSHGIFLPKTIAENVAVANMVNTRELRRASVE